MIKWAKSWLYHGHTNLRKTGHFFMFEGNSVALYNLSKGEYPPFDCVSLTAEDAIKLRDFLNECLNGAFEDE